MHRVVTVLTKMLSLLLPTSLIHCLFLHVLSQAPSLALVTRYSSDCSLLSSCLRATESYYDMWFQQNALHLEDGEVKDMGSF